MITTQPNKAGLIPFCKINGKIVMCFMVSSNARYGGALPQIAKGNVDPGECVQEAALREAQEELGLRVSNIIPGTMHECWDSIFSTRKNKYRLAVYTAEVKDIDSFDLPCYETEYTVWMTLEEFMKDGRVDQQSIVQKAYNEMRQFA